MKTRKCENCGKEFQVKYNSDTKKYCSPECRKEAGNLGRKMWGGKNSEIVIAKLQEVWALGGTNEEAGFYADVSGSAISRYLQKHSKIAEKRERLLQKPILKARQSLIAGLDNPELALKYLERKRKEEFSPRNEFAFTQTLEAKKRLEEMRLMIEQNVQTKTTDIKPPKADNN